MDATEIHLVRYPAQAEAPSSVAARLRAQHERLQQVPAQFEAATVWLLPFALDLTEGVDPRLLAGLLTEAQPHLEEIREAIDDSLATGQSLEGELESEVPKSEAGGGKTTELSPLPFPDDASPRV